MYLEVDYFVDIFVLLLLICYSSGVLTVRVVNFPKISGNISKSLEVITCVIFIRIH